MDPKFDADSLVVRLASRVASVELAKEGTRFGPPEAPGVFDRSARQAEPDFSYDDVASAARQQADRLLERLPHPGTAKPRPVVFSLPDPNLLEALAALTLRLGAAWALEPAADAFVATARWVRPTLLVATPAWLDPLASAWDRGDRRWSRLRAVVLAPGSSDVRESLDSRDVDSRDLDSWDDVFGVPVIAWP